MTGGMQRHFTAGILFELDKSGASGIEKEAVMQWLAAMASRLKGAKPAAPPPSQLQVGVAKMKARLNAAKPDALRTEPPKAVAHPEPVDPWGGVGDEKRQMAKMKARENKPAPSGPKPDWKLHV